MTVVDETAAPSGEDPAGAAEERPRRKGRGVGGFDGAALRDWRTSKGMEQEGLALATRRAAAAEALAAAAAAGLITDAERDERIGRGAAVVVVGKIRTLQVTQGTQAIRDLTADLVVMNGKDVVSFHPDLEQRMGMTPKEFGDMARGISAGQVSHLEQGRRDPTMRTLNLLCSALGCEQEDLVDLPGLRLATAASMHGADEQDADGPDADQ